MAKKKPMVGDRYCKNPSTFNGKSFAPYEKRMSGIDVVSPAPMRSSPVDVTCSRKTQEEVSIVAKYHSAIGVISHASKAILENGWMVRRFFTAPYRLNDTASVMETIGKDPSS